MSEPTYTVGKIEFGPAPDYPDWICKSCGDAYGKGMPEGHLATWHQGECDICHERTLVTEPRDFKHLKQWPLKK
jgi:hypothetical protein